MQWAFILDKFNNLCLLWPQKQHGNTSTDQVYFHSELKWTHSSFVFPGINQEESGGIATVSEGIILRKMEH